MILVWSQRDVDALDEREPIADTCSRSTNKGQQVTPDAWNLGNGLGYVVPSLRSVTCSLPIRQMEHKDALELVSIRSP